MDDPRARRRESEKRYWAKHPERRRELSIKANKKFKERHPEEYFAMRRAITKRYREKHPEKAHELVRKGHADRRMAVRNGFYHVWARLIFSATKARAKRLSIPFNITLDDISVPTICPVLSIPLQFGSRKFRDNSASIDRIDPKRGYVKGNVIVISLRANKIKQDASPEEILKVGHFFKLLFEQRAQAQA